MQSLVEDLPTGYPRFAGVVGSHGSFQLFRRYTALRCRLLLRKQARLSLLEKDLKEIDQKEKSPLFLSSLKWDGNSDRHRVLDDIEEGLHEYGKQQALVILSGIRSMI